MSITALYVYSPTTFKTDSKIEALSRQVFGPGVVDLPPGLYRLAGNANVTATSSRDGTVAASNDICKHNIVVTNGVKTTYPDPPARSQQLGVGENQLKAFLQGEGEGGGTF